MLSVMHLNKSFGSKKILNDISFTVKRGEIAMFLGSSGVGKSTLLRILNNLEQFDSGTVMFDDTVVDFAHNGFVCHLNQRHLIGMVFQHFNLFDHITVERNITLPLEKVLHKTSSEAHAFACSLLEHYGLADKIHKYPSQLSGGQKQRLAIARTVAMKPHIICLDEPTSALDPVLTSHIAETIQNLAKEGYIVLVSSHDTHLLEKLTCTIYLMDKGSIIQTVQSDEFKKNSDAFSYIKNFIAGNK